MVLVLVALLATVCVALYVFLQRRLRPSAARLAAGELTRESVLAELSLLLLVLLGSGLLILSFVVGAYLLIRVGRAVSQKPVGGQATEYVDAWSRYRLSQEQIQATTGEGPADSQTQPDDDDGHGPPPDHPQDPGPMS